VDLSLANRLVVVTGASRGIGRAIAEAFARERCRLHLVARKLPELEDARAEIRRTYGVSIEVQSTDMRTPQAAHDIFNACPHADVLINNAGGIIRGNLLDIDESRWREAWETKVFGYINLMRQYYRQMRDRRQGVIINIIGLGAEKVDYDYVAGSAGNAALSALTRAVGSASMDHGVRVVGVHPGWVETERTLSLLRQLSVRQFGDAERWRDVLKSWQVGELIKPVEIADIVAFLASDRANAMCGVNVNIDRGFGARSYPPTEST
jgi:NAD(P)-dependent dehydrogenase (short-subunit alcohol dehydrogenase family)